MRCSPATEWLTPPLAARGSREAEMTSRALAPAPGLRVPGGEPRRRQGSWVPPRGCQRFPGKKLRPDPEPVTRWDQDALAGEKCLAPPGCRCQRLNGRGWRRSSLPPPSPRAGTRRRTRERDTSCRSCRGGMQSSDQARAAVFDGCRAHHRARAAPGRRGGPKFRTNAGAGPNPRAGSRDRR